MRHEVSRVIAGKNVRMESGWIAKQADGAGIIQMEGTTVFAAVVSAPMEMSDPDFLPLTVDYREKTYAAGKFPGGFIKRETRPSEKEILTMRLIDRPVRPLWPTGFVSDIAITSIVLSADQINDPDILAINAASLALTLSALPFNGPLGAVRVGKHNGQFVINPTYEELENGQLDLVVAGSKNAITMVEAGVKELPEDELIDAIEFGHKHIREFIAMQEELAALCGKPKVSFTPFDMSAMEDKVRKALGNRLVEALKSNGKQTRSKAVKAVHEQLTKELCPEGQKEITPDQVGWAFEHVKGETIRKMIIDTNSRMDGRSLTDIRDITCDVSVLTKTHGSALFTRGETQALVVTTLGSPKDEQMIDGLRETYTERFMLHYNFPAFSVGETWPNRGPKRREIGHGNLAKRALANIMPKKEDFPYTVRVVSDVMESNGSSSMATVCGGTLSLMDAGVQITNPVAGVAMGLIVEGKEVRVLTDILGDEDHYGDMDFKVAGTQHGVTALQMDIKTSGVTYEIMRNALKQAKEARINILRTMLRTLREPRPNISEFAPSIVKITINPEKIGKVIGPGGKTIRGIQDSTKAEIEITDDGTVVIAGPKLENVAKAKKMVEDLVAEVQIGTIYEGTVRSIKEFGAFVEVLPGSDGLLHVSEMSDKYVKDVNEFCKLGQKVRVKVVDIDSQGRIRLSAKNIDAKPEEKK